jgi:hypothetical protein
MTTSEPWFHPLRLKRSQMRLIRDCMWAWTQVPNGHFLPAPRWQKGARDLVARGYLTEAPAEAQPRPNFDGSWSVYLITRENAEKYNADLRQACIEQGLPLPVKEEEQHGEAVDAGDTGAGSKGTPADDRDGDA